jgi:hypothetical protein
MAVDSPTTDPSTSSLATPVLHVSAYVDLPLATVLDRLAPSAADRLLSAAFRAAIGGLPDLDLDVDARSAEPVWVSCSHVRVPITWRISRPTAPVSTGAATISLLVVQSGEEAITELLAVVPIPPEGELRSTAELHKVLDQVARHLEAGV